MAVAKITAKGQATIPLNVRTVLKVAPMDLKYQRAVEGTLSEWSGSADEAAYCGL